MIRVASLAHQVLLQHLHSNHLAIDCTCGRGQDTLFLAQHFQKVIAFDIQSEAISSTKDLLLDNHIHNVELIQMDHSEFDYSRYAIDVAIFNCGYLPRGDKLIRTTGPTTVASLKKILPFVKANGNVILTVYPKENAEEANEVLRFTQTLPSKKYDVLKIAVVNKELAPMIYHIIKN